MEPLSLNTALLFWFFLALLILLLFLIVVSTFYLFISLRKKTQKEPLPSPPAHVPTESPTPSLYTIKTQLHVEAQPGEEQVRFTFVSKSSISTVRIGLRISNRSDYKILINRITWELWLTGLIHYGVSTHKIDLRPQTVGENVVLMEVLNEREVEQIPSRQSGETLLGYLEGVVYCETAYGDFETKFSLLNLRCTTEGERPALPKSAVETAADVLTGFLPRQFLETQLQSIIDTSVPRQSISLIMIDIDGFKNINDTYGHLAGDDVIQRICQQIREIIGETGFAIRYGGDEFCIVLNNHELDEATSIAEKIRSEVETTQFRASEQEYFKASVSLGVAALTQRADYRTLIKYADDVLRLGKREGKNSVRVNRRTIST